MTERIGLLRGKGFELGPYATRYPSAARSMVRLLADQAADRGDATWLVFDGADELSFREAHELTNRVAHALIATVGAGAHVALFLRNQREFMPVFYGAMAAGGAAVPLNADARGPLLEYVIDRSDARVLVSRADLLDRLAELPSLGDVERVLVVGAEADLPASAAGVPVERFEDWLEGHPSDAARPVPRGSRGRADPVHLGHDRALEGGRLPAPVPLPLLGDADRLARPHPRRRPHHAAAAVPRGGAAHHRQLGPARRLHRAPQEPLLGHGLLGAGRRGRGHLLDPAGPDGGDHPQAGLARPRSTA